MKMQKPKVESIHNKDLLMYLKSISRETREVKCPVRSHYFDKPTSVHEYLIPIGLLKVDKLTQQRRVGKDQQIVSQLTDSLHIQGQEEGVCIECVWENNTWCLVLRWGNHRLWAVQELKAKGMSIKNAPIGYIWVNSYSYAASELCKLQSIENNLTKPKKLAQDSDNISALVEAKSHGHLDVSGKKFADLTEQEQRKSLESYIKKYMPAVKQRSSLVNKFYKDKNSKVKTDTWTETESRSYFNLHYAKSNIGAEFKDKGTRLDRVVDSQGQSHALYVMNAQFTAGSKLQQMALAKHFNDPCTSTQAIGQNADVVHLVYSMPVQYLGSLEDRKAAREKILKRVEEYNSLFVGGNVVDFLYILPQTTIEKSNHRKPWVATYKL